MLTETKPFSILWAPFLGFSRDFLNHPRTSTTHVLPILNAKRGAAIARSMIDHASPLLKVKFLAVTCYEDPPNTLTQAFLKAENLCLEDLERIFWREVTTVHKDPGPPWCMLIPSRVIGPFVLLTNEQHVSLHFPGRLHQRPWASLPLPRLNWRNFTSTSQSLKLFPEHWTGTTSRDIDTVFFDPVCKCSAPGGRLTIFICMPRDAAHPTWIFPVRVAAAANLWPYPRHQKHRESSACSQMWHSTHQNPSLSKWSRRDASASAN